MCYYQNVLVFRQYGIITTVLLPKCPSFDNMALSLMCYYQNAVLAMAVRCRWSCSRLSTFRRLTTCRAPTPTSAQASSARWDFHVHAHVYTHVYTYVFAHVYTHVYACLYACLYAYLCACLYTSATIIRAPRRVLADVMPWRC